MGFVEYCVMKDGDNIDVDRNFEAARISAIKLDADYILEVYYDDNEVELGCERVWERL